MTDLGKLKEEVCQANLDLVSHGLVIFTWGNASAIDRKEQLVVIKPSGVPYEAMQPADMVVVDMDGRIVEGRYQPSSDTPTHIHLYKTFTNIGAVAHTHSRWATIWAQAGRPIPALGTTYADYFYGDIPCTRKMTKDEIQDEYERRTGEMITDAFQTINPDDVPGVLVNNHGPFTWGSDSHNAVHNAVVLEEVARMAYYTLQLENVGSIDQALLDKHFLRKKFINNPACFFIIF